jgi:hypothetical protein
MSKYVPSTEHVRNIYGYRRFEVAEFDRWLAKHDAEVQAEAWDQGGVAGYDAGRGIPSAVNPYREVAE